MSNTSHSLHNLGSSPRPGGLSIFSFGLGPALIAAAAWLIFWNEGGAAKTQSSLAEGAAAVVSASADKIDPANDGKLVHVVGQATTSATLTDPLLHVSTPGIRLKRTVEVYQWREVEKRMDGPAKPDGKPSEPVITYEYSKIWNADPIDSTHFKTRDGHANPPSLLVKPADWSAEKVLLGDFELTDKQKDWLSAATPLPLTGERGQVSLAPDQGKVYRTDEYLLIRPLVVGLQVAQPQNDLQFLAAQSPPAAPPADVVDNPKVGDLRVKYTFGEPREVTAMGKQVGRQLVPYPSKSGRDLSKFLTGNHAAEKLFASDQAWSSRGTQFFRVISLGLIYLGVLIALGPITQYAASISWLQPIVARGMFIVRAGLTLAIGAALIGAAWLYYRPTLAISLFVVAGILLVATLWLVFRRAQR